MQGHEVLSYDSNVVGFVIFIRMMNLIYTCSFLFIGSVFTPADVTVLDVRVRFFDDDHAGSYA